MSLRNLGNREQTLLNLYCTCQFQMSPADFYAKWNVTHAQIAAICGCSESTVDRWFQRSRTSQPPELIYLRRLAEMDFLWENYEQVPVELRQQLCRGDRDQTSSSCGNGFALWIKALFNGVSDSTPAQFIGSS